MSGRSGAQHGGLPCGFDLLARANGEVSERRRSREDAAQELNAALSGWVGPGIQMRHRIAVANFQNAQTGPLGRKMRPTCLKKIEVVILWFTREAARQHERSRHTVPGQGFQARRNTAVREVDARAAI